MNTKRVNPFINRQPLKTGGRAPFMERVRKSLGHPTDRSPPPTEPPPEREERLIRQWHQDDPDRVERWIEKAKANSMTIQRVSVDGVIAAIDACLAKHTITQCLLNARQLEAQFRLADYLASRGTEVLRWGAAGCREKSMACDASITDCRAGLADAGSILVWSDESFGRSSTLVIPVHLLLLPASRILPDMIDGLDLVLRDCAGKLPSNIVIINGPSKTADIEMNLITGVHGPKHVYVIVIDEA